MVSTAPIVISIVALLFSILAFIVTRKSSKLRSYGNMINEILELNLQYPQFNDPDFTKEYPNMNQEIKSIYDVYATMVWNCIGLITLEYSDKIDSCPFRGTIHFWSNLHKGWILSDDNMKYYSGIVEVEDLFATQINPRLLSKRKFPKVHRKAKIQELIKIIKANIYFNLLYPFLYPFSSKY